MDKIHSLLGLSLVLAFTLLSSCGDEPAEVIPQPKITAIEPSAGVATMEVVITGENFSDEAAENIVEFNGLPATVINASATELTAIVPEGGVTGPVTVTKQGSSTTGPDFRYYQIYVVGTEDTPTTNSLIKLWRNGIPETISDVSVNSNASDFTVSGADIYVVGTSGPTIPTYWKNNQPFPLIDNYHGGAADIVVDGNDVHIAGWEFNGSLYQARYWKNGVATNLIPSATEYTYAKGIDVRNESVYVAGSKADNDMSVGFLWKDNVETSVGEGSASVVLYDVKVAGDDVYLIGQKYLEDNNNNSVAIAIWKNGVENLLTDGSHYSAASAFVVDGDDVYVTGYELNDNSVAVAKLWINNETYTLSDGSVPYYTSGIAVIDNDIIIAGHIDLGGGRSVGFYAINNLVFELTDGSTEVSVAGLVAF